MLTQHTFISELAGCDELLLPDIVMSARMLSLKLGVNGILLYSNGNLIQVAEGESAAVAEFFVPVRVSSTQLNAFSVAKNFIEKRQFSKWSTGLGRVSSQIRHQLSLEPNTFDLASTSVEEQIAPGEAMDMLRSFWLAALYSDSLLE